MGLFGKNSGVVGSVLGGVGGGMLGATIDKIGGPKRVSGKLFGDRSDAGILGTGQFRSNEYQIDDEAFKSPGTIERQNEFANAIAAMGAGRAAPELNQTAANQWRGQQDLLAQNLQAQMRGEGPSVAQLQMQQGLNQSLGNAASMAASQRGVSPAMAMRLAQQNQAQMAQNTVGQMGMLRAQEQMAARGELANLSNAARTQDLNAAAANQKAALDQRQLDDSRERFYREGQMVMDERNRQANIERERMKSQQSVGYNNINAGAYQNAAQNRAGVLGGMGEGIASIASMFSDEKLKTDIQKVNFDSPMNWGFNAPSLQRSSGEKYFEPTNEAAAATRGSGDDVNKFLSALQASQGGSKKGGESDHAKLGSGIGSILAAAAMAMSDKNEKKGAKSGDEKIKSFLDALDAYTYEYKDPRHGRGPQIGVMAQDMEKSELGKNFVRDTPEGKLIDYGKASGAMMASQAMLNERLSEIEDQMAQFFRKKGGKNA